MLRTIRSQLTYANVAASLALFVALATGGAYAAGELIGSSDIAKNAIKSKHIGKGQVTSSDLATGLLSQGPQGPQGERGAQGLQGVPGVPGAAGSARAYGLVGSSGSVLRGFGVIGDATMPATGVYCITVSPSIDLSSAVVLTGADFDSDGTDPTGADKSLSEWSSDSGSSPCPTTTITIRTFVYNGDITDDVVGGDTMNPDNEAFTFLVP